MGLGLKMRSKIFILIFGIGFVSATNHFHSTNELKYECERNGAPDSYENLMDFLKIFIEKLNTLKNRILYLKGTELYSEDLLRTLVFKQLCKPLQGDIEEILDTFKTCFDTKDYTEEGLVQSKKLMHLYVSDFLLAVVKNTTAECEHEKNLAVRHCLDTNPSMKVLPNLDEKMSQGECKDVNTLLNCFGDLTRSMKCGRRIEMKLVNFDLARVLILSCNSWFF